MRANYSWHLVAVLQSRWCKSAQEGLQTLAVPELVAMDTNIGIADAPLLRESVEGNDAVQAAQDGMLQDEAAGGLPVLVDPSPDPVPRVSVVAPQPDLRLQRQSLDPHSLAQEVQV